MVATMDASGAPEACTQLGTGASWGVRPQLVATRISSGTTTLEFSEKKKVIYFKKKKKKIIHSSP